MGKRILLVSPEPRISWGAAHVLISEGYYVVAVPEASEALKQLSDGEFDIGLIDEELSGPIDGAELARRCAKLAPGLEIILLTARATRRMGKRTMVLRKPDSLCDVRAIVNVIKASCGCKAE